MAFAELNFYSYTLGMDTSITVLLPEKRLKKPEANPDKKYPVLYLLHGGSDDYTSYLRKSVIELLTRDHDLIVVMPTGHLSSYVNTKYGADFSDYITEELPLIISKYFPASDKREDCYIAGLSLGGYGTLHAVLNHPEMYVAAACMSAAVNQYDMRDLPKDMRDGSTRIRWTLGEYSKYKDSENDLFHLLKVVGKSSGPKPKLYQCCGKQDFLYEQNLEFKKAVEESGAASEYIYHEFDGIHNWAYWNKELPRILEFFGFPMNWEQLPL